MERVQQAQSKVTQKSGPMGMTWDGRHVDESLTARGPLCLPQPAGLEAAPRLGPPRGGRVRAAVEGRPFPSATRAAI